MTQTDHGTVRVLLDDPEFRKLYAREEIIEDFLNRIDEEMEKQGISRAELAKRMGCKPANITQIMRRTRNLTVATMVDIAFFLNLKLGLIIGSLPQQLDFGRKNED
jgi:ribosome-binding protein aMBF1 (putative translation factor)